MKAIQIGQIYRHNDTNVSVRVVEVTELSVYFVMAANPERPKDARFLGDFEDEYTLSGGQESQSDEGPEEAD